MTARAAGARPQVIRPSPLSKPTDTNSDRARTSAFGRLTPLAMESGSGAGRSEAIKNVYYFDRQLPPGHDPGAGSGEAPNSRQRELRPLDILVECRG